jgi:hypothetical protein
VVLRKKLPLVTAFNRATVRCRQESSAAPIASPLQLATSQP